MIRPGPNGRKPAPAWLWPNLLGLDAPAVAVSWQLLFARTFDTDFPLVLHGILGLSVWCIYLADRLYDTMRTDSTAAGTDRHLFTRKHFKPLAVALIIASALNLVLIIRYVPERLVISGLITALLLGTYYAIRLKSGTRIVSVIPREILCGMLFSLGCVITPQAFEASGSIDTKLWLAAFSFGLICSASCLLISIWEKDEDLATGDHSLATLHPGIVNYLSGAIAVIAVLSACLAILGPWQIYVAVALAACAQLATLRYETHLSKPMLRVIGDAVLLTPLLFIWV
jgi:hypothetical protein